MIDHWFGRFKKTCGRRVIEWNWWKKKMSWVLATELPALLAIDWMEHWTVEFPIPLKQTGRLEMCTFSHWNIICGLWKMFLLGWWRLVASTFAASAYLNMILLNKEVILWLLIPLENPQILDLIKHQKTKHCLVMLCLHCLCGICCFVADFSFSNFSNACR